LTCRKEGKGEEKDYFFHTGSSISFLDKTG